MAGRLLRMARWTTSLCILVATAAIGAPAADADSVQVVPLRQIGGSGHADLYAFGMATALDGTILIGDYWNFRIERYAADGTYLGTVVDNQGEGETQHQSPYAIDVDPVNGGIVFGDVDGAQLPGSTTPFGHNVDRYDANGNYVTSWGTKGTGPGKYKYPANVAIASDRTVFVADQWGHQIAANTPDGVELFRFGSQGGGPGQFQQPRGMDFDADDNLYVADNYNKRIQVFDRNGDFLRFISGPGTQPGQLGSDLRGVAVDAENEWLYIVDTSSGMISKFDLDGNFLLRWGGWGNTPGKFVHGGRGLTIDEDHNVWVGNLGGFRAQKFTPDGQFLLQVPEAPTMPPEGGFNQPRGVVADAQGNIFVTDTHNQRIQKFAPDGSFLTAWGTRGSDLYKFNYPRGIAVDKRDGAVVIADTDNHRVKKYTNDGVYLWDVGGHGDAPGQFKNYHALDVGPDGRIYVADTLNRRVQVLDENGTPLLAFGTMGTDAGQFQFPRGITLDTDGSIWVTDSIRGKVLHFADDGTFLAEFGSFGSGDTQFLRASGVQVNDTHVFVADVDTDQVKVWGKDGTFVTAVGGSGSDLGKFLRPHGLDLVDDRLFVAEQTGERVQELRITTGGVVDEIAPNGEVSWPAKGEQVPIGPLSIQGTATDNSSVAAARVAIKNRDTGQWWTGSDWGGFKYLDSVLDDPFATSTGWSYGWTPPAPGNFAVMVQARDAAGNVDASKPWITFGVFSGAVDDVAPDGTVATPVKNGIVPFGPVSMTGQATDNVGVQTVQYALKNRTSGQWWTGTTWGSFKWLPADLSSPGAPVTSWSTTWSPPASGDYALLVRATDTSGNVDPTKPWIPFVVTD